MFIPLKNSANLRYPGNVITEIKDRNTNNRVWLSGYRSEYVNIYDEDNIVPYVNYVYDDENNLMTVTFPADHEGKRAFLFINNNIKDINAFNANGTEYSQTDYLGINYKMATQTTIENNVAVFQFDLKSSVLFSVFTTK